MFLINNEFRANLLFRWKELETEYLASIKGKTLGDYLGDKNLTLFAALYKNNAVALLNAAITDSNKTAFQSKFGTFIEKIAISVAERHLSGKKSAHSGIDIELIKDGIHHYISVKSTPNWANKSSMKALKQDCAEIRLSLNTREAKVRFIDGICNGKTPKKLPQNKTTLTRICGKEFWALLSDDPGFYYKILGEISALPSTDTTSVVDMKVLLEEFQSKYVSEDKKINYPSLESAKKNPKRHDKKKLQEQANELI